LNSCVKCEECGELSPCARIKTLTAVQTLTASTQSITDIFPIIPALGSFEIAVFLVLGLMLLLVLTLGEYLMLLNW
jgi:hypothetical protein